MGIPSVNEIERRPISFQGIESCFCKEGRILPKRKSGI
jgi:hypothetical protein